MVYRTSDSCSTAQHCIRCSTAQHSDHSHFSFEVKKEHDVKHTLSADSQVKEVLVVQAKKDTSELVKKKEEVTQAGRPIRIGTTLLALSIHTVQIESLNRVDFLRVGVAFLVRPRSPQMRPSRSWKMPRSSLQRRVTGGRTNSFFNLLD